MDIESLVEQVQGENHLEVDIPAKLMIQLGGVSGFIKTTLVGMDPGRYLIIGTPQGDDKFMQKVRPGNTVMGSYLHRGSLFSFQSQILGMIQTPAALTFITYPPIVSRKELRRDKRVECYLSAKAIVGERRIDGAIMDLSKSGCRFVTKTHPQRGGKPLWEVGSKMEVEVDSASSSKAPPFKALVRNKRSDQKGTSLGVEFQDLDEPQLGFISKFISDIEEVSSI